MDEAQHLGAKERRRERRRLPLPLFSLNSLPYLLATFWVTLLLTSWLPVAAQAPLNPDTVILPALRLRLPQITNQQNGSCPTTSINQYETIQINRLGNHDRAPALDPDLNLQVRGYVGTPGGLDLIAVNGPTDEDAPQLTYLFRPVRVPSFVALYQVNDWDWACCPGGKVGLPLTYPDVSLVEMATAPGEAIYPPRRNKHIGGDHIALVLFAQESRITFTYTREDTPAIGYLIHLENFCVDPNLLALYNQVDKPNRDELPALRYQDSIGVAAGSSLLVAIRDTGSFMDPRSAKDWWQDRVRALLAAQAHQ